MQWGCCVVVLLAVVVVCVWGGGGVGKSLGHRLCNAWMLAVSSRGPGS